MGKSTISMAIFNIYVELPEGISQVSNLSHPKWTTPAVADLILAR